MTDLASQLASKETRDTLTSADTYRNLVNPNTWDGVGDYFSSIFTGKDPVAEIARKKEKISKDKDDEIQRQYLEDRNKTDKQRQKEQDDAYKTDNAGGWFDSTGYSDAYVQANPAQKINLEALATKYRNMVNDFNDSTPIERYRSLSKELEKKINQIASMNRGAHVGFFRRR